MTPEQLSDHERRWLIDHLRKLFRYSDVQLIAAEIGYACEEYRWRAAKMKEHGWTHATEFDNQIWDVQDRITAHHTTKGGKIPAGCYWREVYWLHDLLVLRDRVSARGRPTKLLRSELIQRIFSCYRPGKAKKSANSHFEQTVAMVLAFVNEPPLGELALHDAIVDAIPPDACEDGYLFHQLIYSETQ